MGRYFLPSLCSPLEGCRLSPTGGVEGETAEELLIQLTPGAGTLSLAEIFRLSQEHEYLGPGHQFLWAVGRCRATCCDVRSEQPVCSVVEGTVWHIAESCWGRALRGALQAPQEGHHLGTTLQMSPDRAADPGDDNDRMHLTRVAFYTPAECREPGKGRHFPIGEPRTAVPILCRGAKYMESKRDGHG